MYGCHCPTQLSCFPQSPITLQRHSRCFIIKQKWVSLSKEYLLAMISFKSVHSLASEFWGHTVSLTLIRSVIQKPLEFGSAIVVDYLGIRSTGLTLVWFQLEVVMNCNCAPQWKDPRPTRTAQHGLCSHKAIDHLAPSQASIIDRLRRKVPDVGRCQFEMVQLQEEANEHLKAGTLLGHAGTWTWHDLAGMGEPICSVSLKRRAQPVCYFYQHICRFEHV